MITLQKIKEIQEFYLVKPRPPKSKHRIPVHEFPLTITVVLTLSNKVDRNCNR